MIGKYCSNNTNKLSPQEHTPRDTGALISSNNTNKLSPQEHKTNTRKQSLVQIIQINLVLKNTSLHQSLFPSVQIIQINLVLKNH